MKLFGRREDRFTSWGKYLSAKSDAVPPVHRKTEGELLGSPSASRLPMR